MANYLLSYTREELEFLRTEIVIGGHLRGNEAILVRSILAKIQVAKMHTISENKMKRVRIFIRNGKEIYPKEGNCAQHFYFWDDNENHIIVAILHMDLERCDRASLSFRLFDAKEYTYEVLL